LLLLLLLLFLLLLVVLRLLLWLLLRLLLWSVLRLDLRSLLRLLLLLCCCRVGPVVALFVAASGAMTTIARMELAPLRLLHINTFHLCLWLLV
jgi:hypothetical protein